MSVTEKASQVQMRHPIYSRATWVVMSVARRSEHHKGNISGLHPRQLSPNCEGIIQDKSE